MIGGEGLNPSPDTVSPTVSVTSPVNGATVSGLVNVTATASDNVGVAGVQFKLDGINLGAEDTTSPYSVSWDTTQTANGSHTLTAVARDAAGNVGTATVVAVTVSNSNGPINPIIPSNPSFTPSSGGAPTGGSPTGGGEIPTYNYPTISQSTTTTPPTKLVAPIPLITMPLYFTRSHPQVKILQQVLNLSGFTLTSAGPGAPNAETQYFGVKTKEAVIRFQIQEGVISSVYDSGAGLVGPKTRLEINKVIGGLNQGLESGITSNLAELEELIRTLQEKVRVLQEQIQKAKNSGG